MKRILRPRAGAHARAARRRVRGRWSTTCRRSGGSVQPIVLEGHAELLPRDQPTVAVRDRARLPADDAHSAGARPRRRRRATSTRCSSAAPAAKLLWGDADPIGRRVTLPLEDKPPINKQVVGIVGDVKQGELAEAPLPTVYEYSRELSPGGI